jgi:recombinational DNA repair protein (RecF pathway)
MLINRSLRNPSGLLEFLQVLIDSFQSDKIPPEILKEYLRNTQQVLKKYLSSPQAVLKDSRNSQIFLLRISNHNEKLNN